MVGFAIGLCVGFVAGILVLLGSFIAVVIWTHLTK